MTVIYNDGIAIGSISNDAATRVLWHLYKFFSHASNTHYVILDKSANGGDWDSESGPVSGSWLVIQCQEEYYTGGGVLWEAFIGAVNGTSTLGPYADVTVGVWVAFAARGGWDGSDDPPSGSHDWDGDADHPVTDLMSLWTSATAFAHNMTFNSDGKTFFFGASSTTTEVDYYATDKGGMFGYYKNCLPCDGASTPRQDFPGFIFGTGYPTITNVSPSWAYTSPSVPGAYGYVMKYDAGGNPQGYDRARLSYYLGQTTSYLRGRKPGTFVNLPIPIYGLSPVANTIIYLAGYTTLALAASMDRAWYSTDGSRRNLVRISVPMGTKITW